MKKGSYWLCNFSYVYTQRVPVEIICFFDMYNISYRKLCGTDKRCLKFSIIFYA